MNVAVRLLVQLAVAGGLLWFGRKLLGDAPPRGIRGGIFLMIVFAVLIFFVWRWAALAFEGTAGLVISSLFAAVLLYFAVRFFTGRTGERWMVGLEEQGWFHGSSYKRTLGQKVRRLTILGVLIIGFQRAAFSNEAGVGSAPIAHSAVKTKHPVSEGFVALLEPFIDTVVICTMTALTIVIADSAYYAEQREIVAGGGPTPDGVVVTSRAFGFQSAKSLMAMIMLCCGGIHLAWPHIFPI